MASLKIDKQTLRRALITLAPFVMFGLLLIYYFFKPRLYCLFHGLTHLFCFGCGSGRALTALLHFDFAAAIKNNLFFIALLPLIAYYFIVFYLNYWFKLKLPQVRLSRRFGLTLAALLMIFFILRNIPLPIFEFLRPIE